MELLRPFAFVAPVPRPEDTGVDAVATLFWRDGARLTAEDSFLVQVKSASERSLNFEGKELDWFRALKLPYFLLSVDLAASTLEMYSIAAASTHPNFRDRKEVTLCLDETPFELSEDGMRTCLGPPILRWNPADAVNQDFRKTAHAVLKAWNTLEMEGITLRSLGISRRIQWKTNCKPEPDDGWMGMSPRNEKELEAVLERIRPHVSALMPWAFGMNPQSDGLLTGLCLISEFMRQKGVDPDPNQVLKTLLKSPLKVEQMDASANPRELGRQR